MKCRHAGSALLAGLALGGVLTLPVHAQHADQTLPEPDQAVFQQAVAWSPDGRWLAFSEYAGGEGYGPEKWAIFIIAADGSGRRKLVDGALFMSWSPDGARLAFDTERDGNRDIYVVNADGSGLTRLTTGEAADAQPAWSPVGDLIAFSSKRGDGGNDIYVMASDGTAVRRLTHDAAADFNPAWSPDGKTIVFYREKGDVKDQVHVVDVESGAERRVTGGELHNIYPAFLPDGRIAFVCMQPDHEKSLICVDADGTDRNRVGDIPLFYARWSPDGAAIAFVTGRWPKSAIYLMNADGTSPRKLVN